MPGAHLVFDHHESGNALRNSGERANHIIEAHAPSAARVVYNHYGSKARFARISDEMMAAGRSGRFSAVLARRRARPRLGAAELPDGFGAPGWGGFGEFRISNYQLMMALIDYCRDHSIEPNSAATRRAERVQLYLEHGRAPKTNPALRHPAQQPGGAWTCAAKKPSGP